MVFGEQLLGRDHDTPPRRALERPGQQSEQPGPHDLLDAFEWRFAESIDEDARQAVFDPRGVHASALGCHGQRDLGSLAARVRGNRRVLRDRFGSRPHEAQLHESDLGQQRELIERARTRLVQA